MPTNFIRLGWKRAVNLTLVANVFLRNDHDGIPHIVVEFAVFDPSTGNRMQDWYKLGTSEGDALVKHFGLVS